MILLFAYMGVALSVFNTWAVAGIIALATRNWHPIKGLLKRGR